MDGSEVMRRAKWPVIFLLIAAGVVFYYFMFIKIEPGPLLEEALDKAYQAKSYRYTLKSDLNIGGNKKTWIRVTGTLLNATTSRGKPSALRWKFTRLG
ncbi:hypothetical protein SSCH_1280008 [Syntrophaceticus schinkii]|uniref:Uncharacterized protein n=1 Tax=Syntrophaceticus schinkii TaxID=499207 RepID=A0A0B7MHX3_9FIRM|nr:hypothetical protein SSCH_1280008 [Syntrophaceticus schinkii]